MVREQLSLLQKTQLVGFLELVCRELDLTESQFEHAKEKYESVGEWLNDGVLIKSLGPRIIPQGSVSLGTCVRPIDRNEFDVDLVCKLVLASQEQNQAYIRQIVGERLRQSKTYERILEPLKRGWRLKYAESSKFHLDIIPAVMRRGSSNGEVFVPDRELKRWTPSNPEGYVKWFEGFAALTPRIRGTMEFAARADIQPLPEPASFKSILKRSVQLLKRHRDVHFVHGKGELAPISVIITTLAAKSYGDAVKAGYEYDSDFDLFLDVISNMHRFIQVRHQDGKAFFFIPNETTDGENFAEQWNKHPERATAFYEWQKAAIKDFEELPKLEGLDNTRRAMMGKLGKPEVSKVFNEYTNSINLARSSGRLKVNPSGGLGLVAGINHQPNTYFGR
ncbi:MAG: nucleotidyltransferase [Deltaproteobacteria bacterium HGW-Deltaproteobacteria-15]|nr:MAG: nucleotidyltransferase [Deltaproteobacteria bacterium HGW-Deltaproteobacteria-15]